MLLSSLIANINPLPFRIDTSLSTSFSVISSDLAAFEEPLDGHGLTVLATWLLVYEQLFMWMSIKPMEIHY